MNNEFLFTSDVLHIVFRMTHCLVFYELDQWQSLHWTRHTRE